MDELWAAIGIVHNRELFETLAQVDDRSDQDRVVLEYARRMSEMYREWE